MKLLPALANCWKNFAIDFIIDLLVFTNWKGKTYISIIIIGDRFRKIKLLMKMIHYELVKVTVDFRDLVEVIIKVVLQYYDHNSVFIFWFDFH